MMTDLSFVVNDPLIIIRLKVNPTLNMAHQMNALFFMLACCRQIEMI